MPLSRPIRSETTWPSTTKDEACGSDWTYAKNLFSVGLGRTKIPSLNLPWVVSVTNVVFISTVAKLSVAIIVTDATLVTIHKCSIIFTVATILSQLSQLQHNHKLVTIVQVVTIFTVVTTLQFSQLSFTRIIVTYVTIVTVLTAAYSAVCSSFAYWNISKLPHSDGCGEHLWKSGSSESSTHLNNFTVTIVCIVTSVTNVTTIK